MKDSPSWTGLPPDSAEGATLVIFFTSLACACVALFGERMGTVCLVIAAASTCALYLCLHLQRGRHAVTGFSIDDAAKALQPHGARPIPFKKIVSLRLILYRDCAWIQALTGTLRRRRLLARVSRHVPVQDILDAFTERGFTVRVSRNPFKKRTADILPLLVMPLLAAALLYVSIDMFRRVPGLALPPQQLSVATSDERAGGTLYRLGPAAVVVPRGYRLIDRQQATLMFHIPAGGTYIAIDAGQDRRTVPNSAALQAVAELLGFGSVHDAALLAVHSRFGLMPAMIKAALLKRFDAETVQTYCIRAGALSGVMLRGERVRPGGNALERMPEQVAEIMLRAPADDLIMRVLVSSHAPLDIEHIKVLISGIHVRPQD